MKESLVNDVRNQHSGFNHTEASALVDFELKVVYQDIQRAEADLAKVQSRLDTFKKKQEQLVGSSRLLRQGI